MLRLASSSSSSSLQCLAAVASEATMSSSRASCRGRYSWSRGFSDRPTGGRDAFVSGDSHLRSVTDANYSFRQGERGNFRNPGGYQRQPVYPPPPFRQPRPFRPPRTKPLDHRNWEYALTQPPSHCERFVVLSYNILADYLAVKHRPELYFHIPRHILDWEWRREKIVWELGLWSPDIICLQEVDRFQDLEEPLKLRGYDGVWKMRTGNPVDGCAIFWRTTRFTLLHEEYIEYNKLGLRDNVAQICVLESRNQELANNQATASLTSSGDSNRVVICNIHVLYNPRRGEIKLGQIRVLLDRAHIVAKMWNDAPVVVCGDFNCTPKSPLYNFISEQKLNFIGHARDQISGQSSAQINTPGPYNSTFRHGLHGGQSPKNVTGASVLADENGVDVKQINHISDMQNHHNGDVDGASVAQNLAQPQCLTELLNMPQKCRSDRQYINKCKTIPDATIKEKQHDIVDGSTEESAQILDAPAELLIQSSSSSQEDLPAVHLGDDGNQALTSQVASYHENTYSPMVDSGLGENHFTEDSFKGQSQSDMHTNQALKKTTTPESNANSYDFRHNEIPQNVFTSVISLHDFVAGTSSPGGIEVSLSESMAKSSCDLIGNEDKADSSTSYQGTYHVKISDTSSCADIDVDSKLADLALNELSEDKEEEGSFGRGSTFSPHSTDDVSPVVGVDSSKYIRPESADAVQSSEKCASAPDIAGLPPPSTEGQSGSSTSFDSQPLDMEKNMYDQSAWTPMEIEIATGNGQHTLLEHPLKLKSTYPEVEDYSGTRDSSREPEVTSYNRRFMGTVDYIWRSEGLQTVKVLDTIPRRGLQWTPGFPTPKWGSDHIALATQLAFNKDVDRS